MSEPLVVDVDPLAEAVMVAYCGWNPAILVSNATVVLDGNGTSLAFLPCLNVTAVASVAVTNSDGSVYATTIGAGMTDVGWAANGVLTWQSWNNCGAWPYSPGSIAVTYSGGYDGPPDDLLAALNSVAGRISQMQSGRTSARLGSAAFTYSATAAAGGLLMVEQMIFDKYRIPRVA
jgi:hypothetical protein